MHLIHCGGIMRAYPELYEILSFVFPSHEEFFKEMGWEDDL